MIFLAIGFMFTLLVGAAPVLAQAAPHIAVTLREARLLGNAQAAPLQQFLAEIGWLAGIQVYVEAPVAQEPVTVVFEGLTVEEGLRYLLRNNQHVLLYSTAGLVEVRVYGKGKGEFTGAAVKTDQPPRVVEVTLAAYSPTGSAGGDLMELARLQAKALNHPNPVDRFRALDELSASGDQRLILETALGVLEREHDPEVLNSALDIVAGQAVVPLEPVLKLADGQDPTHRIWALELLSRHGKSDPRVSELFKRVAENDVEEEVRESAWSLLNQMEAD